MGLAIAEFALPETQYAQSGDFSIAYQVMGSGPIDIVLVPGIISHIDYQHELPGYTQVLRRLAKFSGSSPSTREGRASRTGWPTCPLLRSASTMSARSWTRSDSGAPR